MARIRQSPSLVGPIVLLLLVFWAATTVAAPVSAGCSCGGGQDTSPAPPPPPQPFDLGENGSLSLHQQYEYPLPFYGTTNITIEAHDLFPASDGTSPSVELPLQVLLIRQAMPMRGGAQANQTLFTINLPSIDGGHSTPAQEVMGGSLVVVVRVLAVPDTVQPQGEVSVRVHGVTQGDLIADDMECLCSDPVGPIVPGFDVALTLLAMLGVGAVVALRRR